MTHSEPVVAVSNSPRMEAVIMRLIRNSLVIIKPLLFAALISCGTDLFDAANSEQTKRTLTPAEIFTDATLTDIQAQEADMNTGISVIFGACTYGDILVDLTNRTVNYPANSMVFYYVTDSNNYGKMIITNELNYDYTVNSPFPYPPLMVTYVTYDASGNIVASGVNQQVLQTHYGDLDNNVLDNTPSASDFYWNTDIISLRFIQSWNNAKFYRVE